MMDSRTRPRSDVHVGPFKVANADAAGVTRRILEASKNQGRCTAYALHVGGLLDRHDENFVKAFNSGTVAYADGIAVVFLARVSGGASVGRAPTTDVGHDVLRQLALTRPRVRVALIGGHPGLAEEAGRRLAEEHPIEVVYARHGFDADADEVLHDINAADPDILFVGMGMPKEAIWVENGSTKLKNMIIMTCGGWFGFLAGHELRAPMILRRTGLEWVWRWAQNPRRLARRYSVGSILTLRLAVWHGVRRLMGRLR